MDIDSEKRLMHLNSMEVLLLGDPPIVEATLPLAAAEYISKRAEAAKEHLQANAKDLQGVHMALVVNSLTRSSEVLSKIIFQLEPFRPKDGQN